MFLPYAESSFFEKEMNIEGGLLWKRKGTSISGKGTRDNNGG
jgi:hypothetical protein